MITPAHISFNLAAYFLLIKADVVSFAEADILLILCAELIDIDHLFSKPIYHPKRNPFKTHIFHKRWVWLLVGAISLLFFRKTVFLGLAVLSHMLLDWIYVKRNKL